MKTKKTSTRRISWGTSTPFSRNKKKQIISSLFLRTQVSFMSFSDPQVQPSERTLSADKLYKMNNTAPKNGSVRPYQNPWRCGGFESWDVPRTRLISDIKFLRVIRVRRGFTESAHEVPRDQWSTVGTRRVRVRTWEQSHRILIVRAAANKPCHTISKVDSLNLPSYLKDEWFVSSWPAFLFKERAKFTNTFK